MSSRPPMRTLATSAALVVTGVVVLWASSGGHAPLVQDPPDQVRQRTRTFAVNPDSVRPRGAGATHSGSASDTLTRVLAVGVGLLCVFVVVVVVATLWRARSRWHLPAWWRGGSDVEEVGPEESAVEAVRRRMDDDAAAQEALLEAGSPRNAIVACWHRFETQAAQARVARRPAETSSEFTLRLLDLVEADASAVRRLELLYREARFSEHPLSEEHREAARAALRDIHAQLADLLAVGAR